jgi:hypothetical protein
MSHGEYHGAVATLAYGVSTRKARLRWMMVSKFLRDLDPLDLEMLHRAFDDAWAAVKDRDASVETESDQRLEAVLRRELIEIACFNGFGGRDTLQEILVGNLLDLPFSSMEGTRSKTIAKRARD